MGDTVTTMAESMPDLPPPRSIPWKMKKLASAVTEVRFLPDGRLHLRVRHEVLRDVSPGMLAWWFRNLDGDMELEGRIVPRYQVWHPIDHISVTYRRRARDGSVRPGTQLHVREVLGGNERYFVDMVTTVEKLDETGFVHGPRVGGVRVARLEHTFTPVDGGTLYENSITLGPTVFAIRQAFNVLVRPFVFPDDKARAWLRHSVEEIGNLQFFLPTLYGQRADE